MKKIERNSLQEQLSQQMTLETHFIYLFNIYKNLKLLVFFSLFAFLKSFCEKNKRKKNIFLQRNSCKIMKRKKVEF